MTENATNVLDQIEAAEKEMGSSVSGFLESAIRYSRFMMADVLGGTAYFDVQKSPRGDLSLSVWFDHPILRQRLTIYNPKSEFTAYITSYDSLTDDGKLSGTKLQRMVTRKSYSAYFNEYTGSDRSSPKPATFARLTVDFQALAQAIVERYNSRTGITGIEDRHGIDYAPPQRSDSAAIDTSSWSSTSELENTLGGITTC